MLVVTRKKLERICIDDEIEIVVLEIRKGSVKLGVRAPRHITVRRGELQDDETPEAVDEIEAVDPDSERS